MGRPEDSEHGDSAMAEGELAERIGYVRCDLDGAERTLADLIRRRDELRRQLEVVDAENRRLEGELLQRLGRWRQHDADSQRADELLAGVEAVTGSATYRLTQRLLRLVNGVRRLLTLGWLRNR